MAAGKNYRVVLIEALDKKRSKSDNYELHITIQLDDWNQKETISVGAVFILDGNRKCVESLKYEDKNTHISYRMGECEKYRRKTFRLPMSEAAYNQAKTEATIKMIVAEDGEKHPEEHLMKDGMYSWAMEQTMKGETKQ